MSRSLRVFALIALAISFPNVAFADIAVGSKAPKLDIEHWLSNNNGKLPKVQAFQPSRVYVVEFWATWCGPCVQSMPHLAQLQKNYADKGVQIISVSTEELSTVQSFLERKVPNAEKDGKNQTYKELTAGYCLTTDPDESVYADYMEASGADGIPTAFIVGKDGIIEWIGHPMEMDEPLEQIVDGTWDRKKYLKQLEERKSAEAALQEVQAFIDSDMPDKALKRLDEIIAITSDPDLRAGLGGIKISILIDSNPSQAAVHMREMVGKTTSHEGLNALAWVVVEATYEKESVPGEIINVALEAAEKATKLAPKESSNFDTLAHLLALKGDLDKAIEAQKKAVELTPQIPQLRSYLKQLQAEKEEALKKK